ncbi:MAG: hypothetical protein S4CHLAM45_07410 [Chlamydiales bacterium]|nr:hypothetical protein [Chlamydiales bacterium]MCH9620242.1 hypothetical protein [Chlamydiales bacterium]MCH9622848.1 hypothetical protein [Chlamydiales bacterium]
MKKFLTKLLLFSALQLMVLGFILAIWFPKSIDHNQYLAASLDKQKRLHETPSPKVIIVGGSNLVLGFQTHLLEKVLDRPVVNMGLDGEFGLAYKLNEVWDEVGQGDMVILNLEYEHFTDDTPIELLNLLQYNPKSFRYIAKEDYAHLFLDKGHLFLGNMIRASFHALRNQKSASSLPPYARNCFSSSGDIQAHYALPNAPIYDDQFPAITTRALKKNERLLQNFLAHCKEKEATVLYSFPPQPSSRLANGKRELEQLERMLSRLDIEVIGTPHSYIIEWEHCYDNCYHLDEEGCEMRTRLFVDDLQNFVHKSGKLAQNTRILLNDFPKR